MKKEHLLGIILIFIFLITIPQVFAIETNLKETYQPGETIITEILGNFIENPRAEQVKFYSGRSLTPMPSDLGKVGNKYYLYAILPNKERNYTLVIEDLKYFEVGEEKEQDFRFNFSVQGNISDFTVNPGFVVENQNFDINVRSNIKSLDLNAEFLDETKEISLLPGEEQDISFSIASLNKSTITNVSIYSESQQYIVPVSIYKTEEREEPPVYHLDPLKFSENKMNLSVLEGETFGYGLTLLNSGENDLENITINITNLSDIITLQPSKIDLLEAGLSEKIDIVVESSEAGTRYGNITATSGNITINTEIKLVTTESEEELENITQESGFMEEETCSQLGGRICKENEECEGIIRRAADDFCCLGECKTIGGFTTGKLIALIVIAVILGLIGFFVFKRMKTGKKSFKKGLTKTSQDYEKKFKPKPTKQTKGQLSRT